MKQTIEAIIGEQGHIRPGEPVNIKGGHRALVAMLNDLPIEIDITTQLTENSLVEDWLRAEEDEAWRHL